VHPNRGALPEKVSLGTVVLYLLEAIRTGQYFHSYSEYWTCKDGLRDPSCAINEYRLWWDSRQRGGSEYVPQVTWPKLAAEALAAARSGELEPAVFPTIGIP